MSALLFFTNDVPPVTKDFRVDVDATLPQVEIQVLDGEDPEADFTGATVTFTMTDTDGNIKISAAAALVTDGPNAKVGYDFQAADVDVLDEYYGQFKITMPGGGIYRQPNDASQRLRILVGKVDVFA